MKTIQFAIDQNLLAELDGLVEQLQTTRSAFMRDALKMAIQRRKIRQLEQEQVAAYTTQPQMVDEITLWQSEQNWGDEWIEQPNCQKVVQEMEFVTARP